MISTSVLEFHDTFKPEMIYIAKLLQLASECFTGSKSEISEISGIPTGKSSGKVVPHIKYAAFMGLIDYTHEKGLYSLKLTSLGKEVFVQDAYLHEDLTGWICHYCMTRKVSGAPQWVFLIHEVHPSFGEELSQERLFDLAKTWCDATPANMQKKVFSVVKGSYSEGCFERLGFLDWNDTIMFHEQPEKLELTFVYAYALFDSWERLFPEKREITSLELKETLGFGKTFGFNEDECNYVIDSLSDEGLLTINKQLYPATIIRTTNADNMIPHLYSRLL
ncbi:hypothetical protein [Anaeromassilibacillus senegalensis]|uniref:hypothetical protein n=1 Tax=Anaeromassilibacillus senegalensis TaxID=1673717 RepID=UPI0006821B2C|nr:hypothetical protein [Anaeromassilibacillus senegalensis]